MARIHSGNRFGRFAPALAALLLAGVVTYAVALFRTTRNYGFLQRLAFAGDASAVEQLLSDGGIDPDEVDSLGWAPLHAAADAGQPKIAELLLRGHGTVIAKVNLAIDGGLTPLHLVSLERSGRRHPSESAEGRYQTAIVLLQHGADPNRPSQSGKTPLHWAVLAGDLRIVRLLLEHGADATIRSQDGHVPADEAAVLQGDAQREMEELLRSFKRAL